jgi:hypothetical protein
MSYIFLQHLRCKLSVLHNLTASLSCISLTCGRKVRVADVLSAKKPEKFESVERCERVWVEGVKIVY